MADLHGRGERFSRRALVSGSFAGAVAGLLNCAAASFRPSAASGDEASTTVFHVHGFHAAPDRGGGQRVDQQIADMQTLAATSATIILPTEEYLGKAVDARLRVITRLFFNNFDDVRSITEEQLAMHRGVQTPIFQVGNEIDQELFGGISLSPERFTRDVFLPVVQATRDRGGLILIPPMGPGSPTEYPYLDQLLRAIKATIPADVIEESLGLTIHNYFYQGQNPLDRVRRIYQQTTNILGPLPIYITEAGLYQTRTRFYPDDVIRDEIVRYVRMPLGDLPIRVNNWWVIGNRVFRGPPLPEHVTLFEDFETSAWRKEPDAVTPLYAAVSNLAQPLRRAMRERAGIR
jgi:hypothetical protein